MNNTIIKNIRVFDGNKLSEVKTIYIKDGLISDKITDGIVIDGQFNTLIPGLIDSHIHLSSIKALENASNWGITTMLDMATNSPNLVNSLKNKTNLTDVRSCYYPASGKGSIQISKMGFPESSAITTKEQAINFIEEQISFDADYIKIILEDPKIMGSAALTPEIVKILVEESHKRNKKVHCHATSIYAYELAVASDVDVISHTPVEQVISSSLAKTIANKGIIVIPTMIMMEGVINSNKKISTHKNMSFQNVELTVKELKKAGVHIAAGTDANSAEGSFFTLPHGKSLHDELKLLVKTGFSPIEALNSATIIPAKFLQLSDRGSIEIGKKADLVIIEGDPTVDIEVSQNIKSIWISGKKIK